MPKDIFIVLTPCPSLEKDGRKIRSLMLGIVSYLYSPPTPLLKKRGEKFVLWCLALSHYKCLKLNKYPIRSSIINNLLMIPNSKHHFCHFKKDSIFYSPPTPLLKKRGEKYVPWILVFEHILLTPGPSLEKRGETSVLWFLALALI